MEKIIYEQIEPLSPTTAKEFFHNRGTIYECIGIMWAAMQKRGIILNHVLKSIDDQLAANDLAALEADNAGKTALALATKAVEEVTSSVSNHIQAVDKKVAEINALKILFEHSVHEANDFIAMLELKLQNGDLNGKDGKTPVKGVDYFDGRDGRTPVKGVDYFDGKTPVKGLDYTDGKDGKDGKSAYELWLEEGNTGSMTDMLVDTLNKAGVDDKIIQLVTEKVNSSTGVLTSKTEQLVNITDAQAEKIAELERRMNNLTENLDPKPPVEDDPIIPEPDDDDGEFPDFGEITDDNSDGDMEI